MCESRCPNLGIVKRHFWRHQSSGINNINKAAGNEYIEAPFLVRCSDSVKGAFTITALFNNQGGNYNWRISKNADSNTWNVAGKHLIPATSTTTVPDVINFCMGSPALFSKDTT